MRRVVEMIGAKRRGRDGTSPWKWGQGAWPLESLGGFFTRHHFDYQHLPEKYVRNFLLFHGLRNGVQMSTKNGLPLIPAVVS